MRSRFPTRVLSPPLRLRHAKPNDSSRSALMLNARFGQPQLHFCFMMQPIRFTARALRARSWSGNKDSSVGPECPEVQAAQRRTRAVVHASVNRNLPHGISRRHAGCEKLIDPAHEFSMND